MKNFNLFKNETLCIICAKSKSQELPNKNIKLIELENTISTVNTSLDSEKEKTNRLTNDLKAPNTPKDDHGRRKYQKKTDRQHILDTPDTYIGSIEEDEIWDWVLNENGRMGWGKIKTVPGSNLAIEIVPFLCNNPVIFVVSCSMV